MPSDRLATWQRAGSCAKVEDPTLAPQAFKGLLYIWVGGEGGVAKGVGGPCWPRPFIGCQQSHGRCLGEDCDNIDKESMPTLPFCAVDQACATPHRRCTLPMT